MSRETDRDQYRTGTDSKAGTIVHEQTHFDEYGGTRDHAYGQHGCQELAQKDPNTAVMNADSHEYFAENNPFRS
ncbi:Peptidyl-Lys metalloendopeptidase [Ceratobasidium theobromae]|uniref:Peptidyl-Lys metalloendopeptidase n=1 Tax=Ceratobasidium theobromae TaxID=1582974 RepID=A0A5N5QAL8_9AGAM|nr:Peptidyl-Lys metalloendopeptidase [Ceratobasidium theobromae]